LTVKNTFYNNSGLSYQVVEQLKGELVYFGGHCRGAWYSQIIGRQPAAVKRLAAQALHNFIVI